MFFLAFVCPVDTKRSMHIDYMQRMRLLSGLKQNSMIVLPFDSQRRTQRGYSPIGKRHYYSDPKQALIVLHSQLRHDPCVRWTWKRSDAIEIPSVSQRVARWFESFMECAAVMGDQIIIQQQTQRGTVYSSVWINDKCLVESYHSKRQISMLFPHFRKHRYLIRKRWKG